MTTSVRDIAVATSQTSLENGAPTMKEEKCSHTDVEEKIWGRKQKYKALCCKQCHLILQMEPL